MHKKKNNTGKRETAALKENSLTPDETRMKAEPAAGSGSSVSSQQGFPIVGIGASAGGLAAFEAFFSGIPASVKPGMAFILVQHLSPGYKSILSELIQRCTHMQVCEVEDGMVAQPNCVYIIPPGRDMSFSNSALHLLEPSSPHGHRFPIDFFFQSLSQDQNERAICIVLSGTGSDGSLGVRDIKGRGGMVMAQNLESTEYDGMPRSAIATGLVDYVLPPAEMFAQLMNYVAHAFGKLPRPVPAPMLESALQKIFILLRGQTGHDFTQYKPSTIHRRIERRMAVNQIDTLDGYIKYLYQTSTEVESLFHDLLIGVTSFFRDLPAFKVLEEQVIPGLFIGKRADSVIRIWSPGCSTGEEIYSICMLLLERMEALKQSFNIQIFATDIDSRALAVARAGLYPGAIAADVSQERLSRFFTAEPDGSSYRIHKSIRDMIIFSSHDLIKHPPFSRLDLISCRNLLIYISGDLQRKLIPLFHYILNPGAFLFLGPAETVGEFNELFTALDRSSKLFQRQDVASSSQLAVLSHFFSLPMAMDAALVQVPAKKAPPLKKTLRAVTEQALLQQVAPAGALVNGQGEIFYLHGRTGMFLEPASGDAGVSNILKMARQGLSSELGMALHKAVRTKESVRCPGLRVKTNGEYSTFNLSVCPVETDRAGAHEAPLYLVLLEKAALSAPAESDEPGAEASASISALKQQLRVKDEYLQTANEELETINEELQSTNEEMQSVNEELQSTNEELETSGEELQSVNEELLTVNTELQVRMADLVRANNDMNNLLAGTGIGTIFVDLNLRILRFTPTVSEIINLILSDVGRLVGHLGTNLIGYDRIVADTQAVLNTLTPKEVEVQTTKGTWYTMRIMPYRTLDNMIEGVVITFVDITEMHQARETLRQSNDLLRLAVVVRDAYDAITMQDLNGRIMAWNKGAERMYGWSEAEALTMNVRDRIPEGLRKDALLRLHQLSRDEILEPYVTRRITKDGSIVDVSITSTALMNEAGQIYAIATTERTREAKPGHGKEAHNDRQG